MCMDRCLYKQASIFFEREVLRSENDKFTQQSFIATLFTAAILLDQVRILIWNRGTKVIEFVICQLKIKFKITNNENLNNNHKL